jgi:hypothetical protein
VGVGGGGRTEGRTELVAVAEVEVVAVYYCTVLHCSLPFQILASFFVYHYVHRALVYPLHMRHSRPMSLLFVVRVAVVAGCGRLWGHDVMTVAVNR